MSIKMVCLRCGVNYQRKHDDPVYESKLQLCKKCNGEVAKAPGILAIMVVTTLTLAAIFSFNKFIANHNNHSSKQQKNAITVKEQWFAEREADPIGTERIIRYSNWNSDIEQINTLLKSGWVIKETVSDKWFVIKKVEKTNETND